MDCCEAASRYVSEPKIKRYLVMAGASYYASGENDLVGTYDSIEEADRVGKEMITASPTRRYPEDWYSITDLATMTQVHA